MKHGDINRSELSPLPQDKFPGLAHQLPPSLAGQTLVQTRRQNVRLITIEMPPSLYANLLDPAAAAAPAATISGAPVKYSFKKEDEAVAPVEKKTPDGT
jgi:hypothetical protein